MRLTVEGAGQRWPGVPEPGRTLPAGSFLARRISYRLQRVLGVAWLAAHNGGSYPHWTSKQTKVCPVPATRACTYTRARQSSFGAQEAQEPVLLLTAPRGVFRMPAGHSQAGQATGKANQPL